MNCLVIKGSYHKKGFISAVTESFIKGIKERNKKIKIDTINLIDKKINFCLGCNKCNTDNGDSLGKCCQKDDMSLILKKMLAADMLVLASPIYQFNMTAIFKKFNERLMPVLFISEKSPFPQPRNKIREGKKGFIFISTGAPYPINALLGMTKITKKMLGLFCKAFGCGKNFILEAGGVGNEKSVRKYLNKAYGLGLKAGAFN